MPVLDRKPPGFRGRHGSVAFLSSKLKRDNTNIFGSPVPELSLRKKLRSKSLATETVLGGKTQKSPSLPDGNILRHPSSIEEERRQSVRKARSLRALETKRRDLYRKFKAVARMAIFCVKETKNHILRNKTYDDIGPYLKGLQFGEFETEEELLFDPSKFKADKQLRISEETKRILRKPRFDRNDRDIYHAQVALRNLQSYAEYPVRMQRKIVEVGTYETYDAKRVVVREGHPAMAFYFILSGSVVVLVYQGETKVAKPVAYLKKGQTFGELAIIHRTMRHSTVVARETIELLSLSVKDFHRIFMAGGVKSMTDPDHNEFVQSLTLFRGWPIEKMVEEQSKCLFHYFKRGEVLVKDSNFSEWIVIIKSGSVKVLKKLKRVQPYQGNKEVTDFKSEKQKREEIELRNKQRRYVLPDLNIPLRPTEDVDESDHKEQCQTHRSVTLINLRNSPRNTHKAHSNNLPAILSQSMDNIYGHSLPPSLPQDSLPVLGDLAKSRPKTSWSKKSKPLLQSIHVTDVPTAKQFVHSNKHVTFYGENGKESVTTTVSGQSSSGTSGQQDVSNQTTATNRVDKPTIRHGKQKKSRKEEEEDEILAKLHEKKNAIRTITQDLDAKYSQKDPDDVTIADLYPQFVHIQTLTKGQVFGVSELVLGIQPSFCLVSSGAECIMIKKSFYSEHASEALLRQLRQQCSPYPTDDEMQIELQVAVDWQAFRNSTFDHTLKHLSKLKTFTKS